MEMKFICELKHEEDYKIELFYKHNARAFFLRYTNFNDKTKNYEMNVLDTEKLKCASCDITSDISYMIKQHLKLNKNNSNILKITDKKNSIHYFDLDRIVHIELGEKLEYDFMNFGNITYIDSDKKDIVSLYVAEQVLKAWKEYKEIK